MISKSTRSLVANYIALSIAHSRVSKKDLKKLNSCRRKLLGNKALSPSDLGTVYSVCVDGIKQVRLKEKALKNVAWYVKVFRFFSYLRTFRKLSVLEQQLADAAISIKSQYEDAKKHSRSNARA